MSHNNKKLIILVPVVFVLGLVFGHLINFGEIVNDSREIRMDDGGLTNPLLECEVAEDTIASRKVDFTPKLKDFISDMSLRGVNNISVYFRDLNNGPIVGVGQDNSFAPASLLKVPVLIAYLKWSEDKTGLLDEVVLFEESKGIDYEQVFPPEENIVVGESYTVRELLERMIKYSDNQALLLLHKRIPIKYQEELYTLLGVDKSIITDPSGRITVRQYSIFFRILFNSSFLSRSNSEYALKLLSSIAFDEGLRAGVPDKVLVSHKFGERQTSANEQQIHDCGIVYYPNHPYLLCVMTRGEDVKSLVEGIKNVSAFVFGIIDEQYRAI
ncbi:MAG TPA: class A beta-lactamase-related serine hydrolase [Parcubacteria group bacterium]|nr:class A beta-lactamase-related serine hydrolase [Parcubacteria group bacterium]